LSTIRVWRIAFCSALRINRRTVRLELSQDAPRWFVSDWPLAFDVIVCDGAFDALDITTTDPLHHRRHRAHCRHWRHAFGKYVTGRSKDTEQSLAEPNDEGHAAAIGGDLPKHARTRGSTRVAKDQTDRQTL
jgi:hypothetical protein